MAGSRLANAIRPTYHDPPPDDVELAHLSPALLGSLSATTSPCSPGESRPPSPDCSDEYEWMSEDGKFCNMYTKAIANSHPFSNIFNTI